jgi:hypothetical protein
LATNFKSITAKLLFPTKGFSLSVFHSPEMRCKIESFGFNADSQACEYNITPQGFTFNYPDWILPYSGVYVAVEEVELVGQKSSAIDPENRKEAAIDISTADRNSFDDEEGVAK